MISTTHIINKDSPPFFDRYQFRDTLETDAGKFRAHKNVVRLIPFRLTPFRLIPFRLIPFRLIPFRLIPFRLIPFRLIPNLTSNVASEPHSQNPNSQLI
jgi:hypothetical protein